MIAHLENIWCWLNANSDALGSVSAVLTILVLSVTWFAIKRQATASELQADAARALTQAAIEQTNAARDAAESARRQTDLLSSQLEISTAPLLVVEPDDRPMGSAQRIVNRGTGPAFQVRYWRGGIHSVGPNAAGTILAVEPSTLAAGRCVYVPIPMDWDSWTIQYKGMDIQERWTLFFRDSSRGQVHVTRKHGQVTYLE
jgi:hypothetical protein